jgi:peptidoglycan/xylan/chitin deacetylase (PgdA/CDA1 family)/predicted enzyme related to lactoylglutathione lyase
LPRVASLAVAIVIASAPWAAGAKPTRPRVLGISHVAFQVSDLAAARAFYEDFLGYRARPVTAAKAGPGECVLVPVNDRQYVELQPGLPPGEDRLDHVALETDDVEAMRRYLASRGIDVPVHSRKDPSGNRSFTVRDPEGHALELVQHPGQGGRARSSPAADPVSRRILHAGILVGDLVEAAKFYGETLGLTETWRGSSSGTVLSWTNMRVPEGTDYLEFMLYGDLPAPNTRGTAHHLCLEVPEIERARARLEARPYRSSYPHTLEARVGRNRKRQLNLFDPDGTRVELMEPDTVDGHPTPPSTAPLPQRTVRPDAPVVPARSVAVTFDDLPGAPASVVSNDVHALREMTGRLLNAFRAHRVPVVGFVNAGKLFVEGEGPADVRARTGVLEMWRTAGLELGNHTWSHPDLNTTPLEEFEADVVRGEPVIRRLQEAAGGKLRYFRHPFLHVGLELEKRRAFEAFLAERGYTVAPVTIDDDDYIYAAVYADALRRGDRATAARVGEDYLRYMDTVLTSVEAVSRDLTGREIRQVLLLHANALNADYFARLAAAMEERGYRFITMEEALADEAYGRPDTYVGRVGFSWLHHWELSAGRPRSPTPDPPAWLMKAYQGLRR